MTLPHRFQFSQASLQDYVDCPRRFQLRYVLHLAWPALEAEPPLEHERRLLLGAAFHHLVHQNLLGLSPERLASMVADPDLARWWRSYLTAPPADLPASRYPEVSLSAPVGGYRLVAKYDLVAVEPERQAVIVDWKTWRGRPRREWLAERLQTRVYPYLLLQAGSQFNGGRPLRAEQVEMVYWFADSAGVERFPYDAARHEADAAYLSSLIGEIAACRDWLPTAQERRCRYCPYRSLCRRGVRAGPLDEIDGGPEVAEALDFDLDLEQIAEIEY